jgi:SAM-dependent methyltransferase
MPKEKDATDRLSTQDAIVLLRKDPDYQDLIRDSYLGEDIQDSADRFSKSAEFGEVLNLLGNVSNRKIIDLGSGIGIVASAFAGVGAKDVLAIDPDLSDQIGARAAARLSVGKPVRPIAAYGENLPLDSETFDILYSRQVLHHAGNLKKMVKEIFRALNPGGIMLSTREHVVDDVAQLKRFRADHPVHRLAGGEHAYKLSDYIDAIQEAGFEIKKIIGPWDSVVNAFPNVRSQTELRELPNLLLRQKLGRLGAWVEKVPGVKPLIWLYLRIRRKPGRMYSFLAQKPANEKTVN